MAAVAGLAALAAVAGALVSAGGEDGRVPPLRGAGVVRVDAARLRVAATTALAGTPAALAAGRDRAWVIDADDQTITELARSGRARRTFATGATPTGIAVAPDGLWLAEGTAGAPRTVAHLAGPLLAVRSRTRLPAGDGAEGPAAGRVAVGVRAVWAIGAGGRLARLDPATGRVQRVFAINARAVATDGARAWVLTGDGTLTSIAETAASSGVPIDVPGAGALAVGGGAVWLLSPEAGTVARLDPDAPGDRAETVVGAGAAGLAYGAGAVWVLDPARRRVVRLDAGTGAVTGAVGVGEVPRALAVTGGDVWVSASPREAALATSCAPAASPGRLAMVAELPVRRGATGPTDEMAAAMLAVMDRRGYRAGRHRVSLLICDDSTSDTANYDPEKCAANARSYAADPRIVIEIGPYNSGCADRQIPIAATAPGGPLGMVSPTATDPLLTRGRQTGAFTRVVATDADQAAVMAAELRRRGERRVFVVDDGAYGQAVGSYFAAAAVRAGLRIVGRASWPRAQALARRIAAARPDAIYVSGSLDNGAGALLRRLPGGARLAGPDLLLPVGGLYADSRGAARGMLLTTTFAARGGAPALAARAAELALDAVARSDGTRASVAAVLRRLRRFDADGDLARAPVALLEVRRGGSRDLLSTDGARRLAIRTAP